MNVVYKVLRKTKICFLQIFYLLQTSCSDQKIFKTGSVVSTRFKGRSLVLYGLLPTFMEIFLGFFVINAQCQHDDSFQVSFHSNAFRSSPFQLADQVEIEMSNRFTSCKHHEDKKLLSFMLSIIFSQILSRYLLRTTAHAHTVSSLCCLMGFLFLDSHQMVYAWSLTQGRKE